VKGAMMELVGGVHGVISPGSIGWKTTGASLFLVGGGHSTKTASAVTKTMGVSSEALGALHVKSGASITRVVSGAVNTTIAGSLKSTAGGAHNIKVGGVLKLKVGGSLTLNGATVTFVCGGSKVAASPGGVLIEAGTITITQSSKQSSKATHA
jgi:type VI secretion system secreted protein VgrG